MVFDMEVVSIMHEWCLSISLDISEIGVCKYWRSLSIYILFISPYSFKSIFVNANAHGCLQFPAGIVGHLYYWCYMQRCKTEIVCMTKAFFFCCLGCFVLVHSFEVRIMKSLKIPLFLARDLQMPESCSTPEELRDRIAKLLREIENLLILLFADLFLYGFFWESWQTQEDSLCF